MNNLDKILNLIKRTGDKMIIADEFGGRDLVIMPLSEYEKIVAGQDNIHDLSEKELLDQVERDIALWRETHQDEDFLSEPWDKEPWERETLPWKEDPHSGEWGTYDAEKDSFTQPWDEEEEETIEDDDEHFKIPEVGWDSESTESTDEDTQDEGVKYEDIPPPPSLVSDLIDSADEFEEDKKPIIDMGFEEDDEATTLESDEEGEFTEEPVF